jgi:hypothetical protein
MRNDLEDFILAHIDAARVAAVAIEKPPLSGARLDEAAGRWSALKQNRVRVRQASPQRCKVGIAVSPHLSFSHAALAHQFNRVAGGVLNR